jgi:hypothetical protein
MLQRVAATLKGIANLPGEFVVFLEPLSLDALTVKQFALFSLMSTPNVVLDDWLRRNSLTFRRIIVLAGSKWEAHK